MHAAAALAHVQPQHLHTAESYSRLLQAAAEAYAALCHNPVSAHSAASVDVRALPGLQQQLRATLLHLLSLLPGGSWQVQAHDCAGAAADHAAACTMHC